MMYYVLAGQQPEGIMALTSIYGPNSAVFSFFLICFFGFSFSLTRCSCKVTEIPIEVNTLIYI